MDVVKRFLLGRALATSQADHQLLPKLLALPVFSSDALSSVAYATEEMMFVLVAAGSGALSAKLPLALAIAVLLGIVVSSYRQTVKAYPQGGGSYIVAKENLGTIAGLVAAAAILSDYVLTVAVSVTAGTIAVTSAAPTFAEHKVPHRARLHPADHAREPPRLEGERKDLRPPHVRIHRDDRRDDRRRSCSAAWSVVLSPTRPTFRSNRSAPSRCS